MFNVIQKITGAAKSEDVNFISSQRPYDHIMQTNKKHLQISHTGAKNRDQPIDNLTSRSTNSSRLLKPSGIVTTVYHAPG